LFHGSQSCQLAGSFSKLTNPLEAYSRLIGKTPQPVKSFSLDQMACSILSCMLATLLKLCMLGNSFWWEPPTSELRLLGKTKSLTRTFGESSLPSQEQMFHNKLLIGMVKL